MPSRAGVTLPVTWNNDRPFSRIIHPPQPMPDAPGDQSVNALIIDDDPLACELLRLALDRVSRGIQVVGVVGTLAEASVALTQNNYDLVFLDIQLIDGDGFDLVPLVRPAARIIFVTGRDDHAVRAFELNALDYIIKPVTIARLQSALRRLQTPDAADESAGPKFGGDDTVFLKGAAAGGRFAAVRDIMAIVSSENYSEVWLADGERWLVRKTMQAWECSLPAELFARVHRTAIVNVRGVDRIDRTADENTTLLLRGLRQTLPVSRRLWSAVKARLERTCPA
jgi:two-component system LytT family response regulator